MATSYSTATLFPVNSRRSTADRLSYRSDVDGLRAVAALTVIMGHTAQVAGTAGVDIFFVISGYLISGIIWRELVSVRPVFEASPRSF